MLAKNSKVDGIIYASFKYGSKEEFRNGRIFNYHNEETIREILLKDEKLEIIKTWVTGDVRPGRDKEQWLNVLMKRKS